MPFEIGVFMASLMFFLPASVAIFPQSGKLRPDQIEENLMKKVKGDVIYYNKGL